MGLLEDSTPRVPGFGIIVLLFNIFVPGLGTALASIMTDESEKMKPTLIVAFLQFFTSMCVVGWCWSVLWGFKIMQVSDMTGDLP